MDKLDSNLGDKLKKTQSFNQMYSVIRRLEFDRRGTAKERNAIIGLIIMTGVSEGM